MGLGETAEAGATVLALLLLAVAVVLVPVLYLIVRALTGQPRWAFAVAGGWVVLVVVLSGVQLLSPDSRAQREVRSARDDIVDAAGQELGGDGDLAVGVRASSCPAGGPVAVRSDGRPARAWTAYGYGNSPDPAVIDRFATALRDDGFAAETSTLAAGDDGRRTRPGTTVVGTRGAASVVVVVYDDAPDQFFVEVEQGCLETPER